MPSGWSPVGGFWSRFFVNGKEWPKPFNFMFINTDTQRIFKNFDELIIED